MRTHPLVNLRGVALYPSPHSCVIHGRATLTRHLFQLAVGELIPTIPTNTQKDERRLEAAPLEGRFVLLNEDDSRRVVAEMEGGL